MAEWLKARAWKVRMPQKGIVGSNPAFSASVENGIRRKFSEEQGWSLQRGSPFGMRERLFASEFRRGAR